MAVEVIATIKPKNNGNFPIVEATDVDVNGTPLNEVLEEMGNGTALRLKIEDNDQLYASYDEGKTWELVGTLPKGPNGTTPQFSVDDDDYLCVSYDEGKTYTRLTQIHEGVDGVTPVFKIDENDYLCVSYDNGKNYTPLGAVQRGKQGESIARIAHQRSETFDGVEVHYYQAYLTNGNPIDTIFSVRDGKPGGKGERGEPGPAGNITINGSKLKFFVGTKAKYDELEDKTNVFAIITDDQTQIGLIDKINGFIDGSIPIPNLEQTYVRKDEQKIYKRTFNYKEVSAGSEITLQDLPEGKSIDDIVGVGIRMRISWEAHSFQINLSFSSSKSSIAYNGVQRFVLHSIGHDVESTTSLMMNPVCMAEMNVSFHSTDGSLSMTFDDVSFTIIDADDYFWGKMSETPNETYEVITVVYWFA